jgi:hypothetical protein
VTGGTFPPLAADAPITSDVTGALSRVTRDQGQIVSKDSFVNAAAALRPSTHSPQAIFHSFSMTLPRGKGAQSPGSDLL